MTPLRSLNRKYSYRKRRIQGSRLSNRGFAPVTQTIIARTGENKTRLDPEPLIHC